jgi:hypothetical protein
LSSNFFNNLITTKYLLAKTNKQLLTNGENKMGTNFANELSNETSLTLANQISIHFSTNCYPPVPQFMVEVAVEAIHACNEQQPKLVLELPNGVTFRGDSSVLAYQVIDQLRLEAWVK